MQGRQRHWGGTPRPAKMQTNGRWRQSTPQEDAKNSQDMNKKGDVPAIDRRQAPKRIAARGKAKELRTEYIDDECRGWAHRRVRGIGRGHAVSYHGSGELKPKCATPALRVAAAEASWLRMEEVEIGIEKEDEKERGMHHIISYEHDPSGSYCLSPPTPPEPAPDPSHTPPRDESETAPCSAGSLAPRPRPAQTRARAHRACGPQCAARKAPGPELRARVDGEAWNRAAWNKRLGAAPVFGIAQEYLVYESFDDFRKDGLRRSCG
ncbi:hypothetical protein C8J57DRAFT_1483147 [Mycena rebaudengoi]|nr:hypothetical protein C8J57DRAFT_1483147 [Mycena rebaudengoi]